LFDLPSIAWSPPAAKLAGRDGTNPGRVDIQYLVKVLLARAGLRAGCSAARGGASRRLPAQSVLDITISYAEITMAQLLVRNLDDDVKAKLQRRARRHGRSTEEEVRDILRTAVREEGAPLAPLGSRLRARFARIGTDAEIPEMRGQPAHPAEFDS